MSTVHWKECLRERFFYLFIAICEWLFDVETEEPDPFADVWIRARFGGIEVRYRLGDDVKIMYTVSNDHPDEPFSVAPVTGAKDKEGEDIPAEGFTTTDPVSDNEASVSVIDDPDVEGGKKLHFGSSGSAHVAVETFYRGLLVKRSEGSFTVTTGEIDPNTVQGGDLVIPGLTPDA